MNKLIIPAILTATVLVAGMFAFMPIEKAATVHTTILGKRLVVQSALLTGLAAGDLFPFIDSTPHHILSAHITITDATAACAPGNVPTSVQVLVGVAGGTLNNVMVGATNTGIGGAGQCVFHVNIVPGTTVNGVAIPNPTTDIVVVNAGGGPLTAGNTIEVSADVDNS